MSERVCVCDNLRRLSLDCDGLERRLGRLQKRGRVNRAALAAATSNANVLAIRLDIAERALLDVAELLVSVDGCAYCPVWDSINVGCRPPNDDRSCAARIAEQAKEKVAKESDER